jgi:hypothetical protein
MSINVPLDDCDLPIGAPPCTIEQAAGAKHVFLYALNVSLYAPTAALLLRCNPELKVYRPTTTAPFGHRKLQDVGFIDARMVPHVEPVGPFTRAPPCDVAEIRKYFSLPMEEHGEKLDAELLAWCSEQREALYDKHLAHMEALKQQLNEINIQRNKFAARFLDLSEEEFKQGQQLGEDHERIKKAILDGNEMSGLELFQAAVNEHFNVKQKKRKR